jgi:predicted phosphoadenosine phosphosulfate sulfurtransferase
MCDIIQITGHRTTESFLKYIRVTKLETAEKLKDHPFLTNNQPLNAAKAESLLSDFA